MKIGLHTSCMGRFSFEHVCAFAEENGFSALEIVCTPMGLPGEHHIDVENLTEEAAEAISESLARRNLEISALGCYGNPAAGENAKELFTEYIKKVIDAAAMLKVEGISTHTGYNPYQPIGANIQEFAETFKPILEYAGEKKVRILLENTPFIEGGNWGNFAYSPEIWDLIFTNVPDPSLGLNYDPSHFFWLGIDYALFMKVFADRIFHVQAKDSEIIVEKLRMTGILGQNWFRYRLPGSGAIDWRRLITTLYDAGYDGVLSLENDDPLWLSSEERIKRGLLLGKKALEAYIV